MGNRYKRVVYVGIRVPEEELWKALGIKGEDKGDKFWDWQEKQKLILSGHDHNVNQFGYISTEDDFICIGKVIDAAEDDWRMPDFVDILANFEKVKFEVAEKLRNLKICVGEIKIYSVTLGY